MPSQVDYNSECAECDAFEQLVNELSAVLGPCSGIDSDDVDPMKLQGLMELYQSKQCHWSKYAFKDSSRAFTRNLVDEGNGKSNLLILVWNPGKGSPVHDHANSHCIMKVLHGSLRETRYEWPGKSQTPLQVKKETIYKENQVTYMSDELGLHRVSNPSLDEPAVSLHLYTPPNAAKYGCHMFDEKTGVANHVKQCHFFSVKGTKSQV